MTEENTQSMAPIFFLAGGVIGVTLGLLFAPRSGEETRRLLREGGEQIRDDLEDTAMQIGEGAQKVKDRLVKMSEDAQKGFHDRLEDVQYEGDRAMMKARRSTIKTMEGVGK